MTEQQFWYLIGVAIISGSAAFFGNWLSSRTALKASTNALLGVDRQMRLQGGAKVAEFRQAWINELREAMANYQSYAVTPNLNQHETREYYKFGTQIELLMNRKDLNYARLEETMYDFLRARTTEEKYRCNDPYVRVCQDILKTEWEVLKAQLAEAAAPPRSS